MSTPTEISNLALANLGISKVIANLDTERSNESVTCRQFYETVRDAVLRDFAWPFASKQAPLGLVTDFTGVVSIPPPEWTYNYAYPSDCIRFGRILSGDRNDTRQSRVPVKFFYGASGRLIACDMINAVAEYTMKVTDSSRFTPDFVIALSFRLSSYIAPRLTGGDPFKMGPNALKMYQMELTQARASAVNEDQPEEDPQAEGIRARDE